MGGGGGEKGISINSIPPHSAQSAKKRKGGIREHNFMPVKSHEAHTFYGYESHNSETIPLHSDSGKIYEQGHKDEGHVHGHEHVKAQEHRVGISFVVFWIVCLVRVGREGPRIGRM